MQILNERIYRVANKYFFPIFFKSENRISEEFYKINDSVQFKIRSGFDKFIVWEVWKLKEYADEKLQIKKTDTVVDIGAHIGAFSIWAANQASDGMVLAYEPFADNYELLKFNNNHNKITNLSAYNMAVTNSEGTIDLFISNQNSGANSTVNEDTGEKISVRSITLEGILIENNLSKIDFLKLDVEGAEYEILFNTPTKILKKIDKIVLEYHDYLGLDHDHKELISFLKKNGFEVKVSGFFLQRLMLKSGIIKAYRR